MSINSFTTEIFNPEKTQHLQTVNTEICQTDYPVDWYQQEFVKYANEFQALPDRDLVTILAWMQPYVEKAKAHFGEQLLLAAHYYMGGEIVNIIKYFGGYVGDSYQLAMIARKQPEKKIIVESAVHFMAEAISILAHEDQQVYITNPKSGCTMEMLAKDYMVAPALEALNQRYGAENIIPICYMNTSGRIKAMTGAQGGAVCTSSNVKKIFEWALAQNKKILFIPDRYMGENVADWLHIPKSNIAYWPAGVESRNFKIDANNQAQFDAAQLFLFASHCGVHSYYQPDMADYWHAHGYTVLVHPECRNDVVRVADGCGSTAFLWDAVTQDKFGTKKYAIGTENHMVKNLRETCRSSGIDVVNLSQIPDYPHTKKGCGCATMSRNDPPHLVATLDLLRQGKMLDFNCVKSGDVVDEVSGQRERLNAEGQQWIIENARKALEKMIEITEG